MFGSLKKRLEEVVKKFSKDEKKQEKEADKKQTEKEQKEDVHEKHYEKETLERIAEKDEKALAEEKELIKEQEQEIHDIEKHVVEEKPEQIMKELKEEMEENVTVHPETSTEEEEFLEKMEKERKELESVHVLDKSEKEKILEKQIILEKPIELDVEKESKEKKGIFGKLFSRVVEKKLEESEIVSITAELQRALLENDVAYEVAERICLDVKNDLVGKTIKRGSAEHVIKSSLRSAMLDVMQHEQINIENPPKKPFTILFLGFNGTGKTTTIAKVGHKLKKKHKVILAAGDTFRAASIEQIEEHGRRLGLNVIKHKYGSDSAAVVFDAMKHAASHGIDYVLADTAGRSHSNVNLMDELKKVVRVNNPDMKILVLDSLTGNDIYDQAKLFNEAVGVDAIILTKADVYEKGGSALSASYTIKKPILFLGTGQEYDDLKPFRPEEIVKNLLGD